MKRHKAARGSVCKFSPVFQLRQRDGFMQMEVNEDGEGTAGHVDKHKESAIEIILAGKSHGRKTRQL